MKFNRLDTIDTLSDTKIVASKSVSLAEEYLVDHFPTFPVLPGVLMIEALVQSASWLLFHRSNFSKSIAVLKEARNVRYGQFVAPGNTLKVEVELLKETDSGATFKAVGVVYQPGIARGEQALSARIELAYFSLAEKSGDPNHRELDQKIIAHNKFRWNVITASGMKLPQGVQI